ncbi:MAG: HAMP domain-containing sensor histidine kinase, partial [Planctomycetota bacterium]
ERALRIRFYNTEEWAAATFGDGFHATARRKFAAEDAPTEHIEVLWADGERLYHYALVVDEESAGASGPSGVLVIERRSPVAASQIFVNRMLLIGAGLGAGALAVLVFYLITTRIILGPVRALRDTAEKVKTGNLHVRSEIHTGDEFQQLSETFNGMLENLTSQQAQLRGINRSLDLKLNELAERNVALYEAARLKGEFLANISHELRTPLNSIIGFAEILQEMVTGDLESADEPTPNLEKRKRYLSNIVNAGHTLLEMINELLTMAKIDAGTIEVHVQPMNVIETCEGLIQLIRPLADRKNISLSLQMQSGGSTDFTHQPDEADLPIIETDPQKFQQIAFNFLSNAVKFTPDGGEVTLRAERMLGADGELRLRMSVLDTGPGIPPDKQALIFEKFSQLEEAHTRSHQGTGLGLAIAREFADMLQGEIQLVSEVGRGSMFSVVVPAQIDERRLAEDAARRAGADPASAQHLVTARAERINAS